jgi:hypothetical protein
MDFYGMVLRSMFELISKLNMTYWINWINEDITCWERDKSVDHHLNAFHKEGLSDVWVCVQNGFDITVGQEPWAQALHEKLCVVSINLARQIKSKHEVDIEEALSNAVFSRNIQGSRCLKCGFMQLSQSNIDFYLAPNIILQEFCERLRIGQLNSFVSDVLSLNINTIEKERSRIRSMMEKSNISFADTGRFMRPCKKCESADTAVYRWEEKIEKRLFQSDRVIFVPSKDNLPLRP